MTGPLKEVLLVGFGAVGSIYSLILKRSGMARVTVVARSNYSIVNEKGIEFRSKKYGDIKGWKPDRLCPSIAAAADQPYSHVILTTKAVPELISTPTLLAPLLSKPYTDKFKQPTYVLLQNGLNVEKELYEKLEQIASEAKSEGKEGEEPSVIGSAVWIGTNLVEGNVVEHNDFDRVTLGTYHPPPSPSSPNQAPLTVTPHQQESLQTLATMLEKGGSTMTVVPPHTIQHVKFAKNLWNVAFSSFCTLTGWTIPAMCRAPPPASSFPAGETYEPWVHPVTAEKVEEYTWGNIAVTLDEVIKLGRVLGYPDTALPTGVPSDVVATTITNVRNLHVRADSTHVPSMLLDKRLGRPLEVEVILGELVRMAKERGVDVPRVELLYSLLLVVQNQIIRESAKTAVSSS